MVRFLWIVLFSVVTAVSAVAATPAGTMLSADKRITVIPLGAGHYLPDRSFDAAAGVVAGNLATLYPKGEYFCCYGDTLSGPTSPVGQEIELGVAFTPATTATLGAIRVGVGYVAGTNAISISLYSDSSGVPGSLITTLNVPNLPTFGTCCAVATAPHKPNVTLVAGTQYWVVVATPSKTTWAAWNFNTSDQIDTQTLAINNGAGWSPSISVPGLAFTVYAR